MDTRERGDSRERLIVAMSELMWERGFAATSPREVRARSGVGQGSMYHHFPSKRDLALAALERNCQELLPDTEDPLSAPGDPLEKLTVHMAKPREALKGCKVGRMTQDPLVAADPGLLAPVADAFDRVHVVLVGVIREAIDAGELRDDLDPDRIASLLQATIQGGYVLAIARQDRAPYDEAIAGAVDLLRAAAPVPADTPPADTPTADTPVPVAPVPVTPATTPADGTPVPVAPSQGAPDAPAPSASTPTTPTHRKVRP